MWFWEYTKTTAYDMDQPGYAVCVTIAVQTQVNKNAGRFN